MGQRHNTQVLILGGGVAGLGIALRLAGSGQKITVLAKRTLTEGSSRYAQGGIAAVTDAADSVESHVEDTLQAGVGLCQEATVRFIAENAQSSIEWLLEQGADFTRDENDQSLHLTQEGGHSQRRVVHASDATGVEVMRALEEKVRACPDIEILDQSIAIDLITSAKLGMSGSNQVLGVYALNKNSGRVELHKLHICNPTTCTPGHGHTITRRCIRVTGIQIRLRCTTCCQHHS
jgi:L-aspartate oxidase